MVSASWHREEPRDVRPFFNALKAQDALQDSGIRLFDGGDIVRDTEFDLDEVDFKKLAPVVYPSVANPDSWLPAGITKSDLKVVLIGRQPILRRSLSLAEAPLNAAPFGEWAINANTLARLGGGRNLRLTLALCLAEDRPPTPGAPFIEGFWLSRKSFSLRTRTTAMLFDLRTRTDAEWVADGYPAKTFYAVEYMGGIDTELEEGASVARVWVHQDAHNKMVSSGSGDSLQRILSCEIIAAILQESLKDWENAQEVDPKSPLATLLKQIGKGNSITIAELRNFAAKPARLKALLHDRLSVVGALK